MQQISSNAPDLPALHFKRQRIAHGERKIDKAERTQEEIKYTYSSTFVELQLVFASASRRCRSTFIFTPTVGVRRCSSSKEGGLHTFCKFTLLSRRRRRCWLPSRFSEFGALLKGTCRTVCCLAEAQWESGYNELSFQF